MQIKFDVRYGDNILLIPLPNGDIVKYPFIPKFGRNRLEIPIYNEIVVCEFDLKFGNNEIEIELPLLEKLSGRQLSNLFSETFTIFNQIPASQNNPSVRDWKKHIIRTCDKRNGILDKSTGEMAFKANSWTVMCKDWQTFKKPLWVHDGYYTLPDYEKENFWTANVGDLVVFADVPDLAPTSVQEFNALREKYKDNGGQITSAQEYINFRPNGKAWASNHIEMIKG